MTTLTVRGGIDVSKNILRFNVRLIHQLNIAAQTPVDVIQRVHLYKTQIETSANRIL